MNQRLTRRDIKRDIRKDDFIETLGHGVDYATHHTRQILLAAGGLALAIALGLGVYTWTRHRGDAANDALADALRVLQAPVDATAAKPDDPSSPSFPSEEVRRERAQALFEKLEREHPGSDAAAVGNLYLAGIAAEKGDAARARELWQGYLKDHKRDMLAAAVQLQIVRLDRAQGKGEDAAKELRVMLEDANRALPEDVVLYELATTLDSLGKKDEARTYYQRIVDEFQRSPYHAEAQRLSGPAGGGAPRSP